MENAHEAGSRPQPAGNHASNGEIVPDDDASAESLRHSADVHPASDHEPPADSADEEGTAEEGTAEEAATLEAGGERTNAPTERTKIEGPNSA